MEKEKSSQSWRATLWLLVSIVLNLAFVVVLASMVADHFFASISELFNDLGLYDIASALASSLVARTFLVTLLSICFLGAVIWRLSAGDDEWLIVSWYPPIVAVIVLYVLLVVYTLILIPAGWARNLLGASVSVTASLVAIISVGFLALIVYIFIWPVLRSALERRQHSKQ